MFIWHVLSYIEKWWDQGHGYDVTLCKKLIVTFEHDSTTKLLLTFRSAHVFPNYSYFLFLPPKAFQSFSDYVVYNLGLYFEANKIQ